MININGRVTIETIVNHPGSTFNGELQNRYNVITNGWLGRSRDGSLHLLVELDKDLFPEVKCTDDMPTRVRVKIL